MRDAGERARLPEMNASVPRATRERLPQELEGVALPPRVAHLEHLRRSPRAEATKERVRGAGRSQSRCPSTNGGAPCRPPLARATPAPPPRRHERDEVAVRRMIFFRRVRSSRSVVEEPADPWAYFHVEVVGVRRVVVRREHVGEEPSAAASQTIARSSRASASSGERAPSPHVLSPIAPWNSRRR